MKVNSDFSLYPLFHAECNSVINRIAYKMHWCLDTKEPDKESALLSTEEIEEIELKERKQREKEKLDQAVKQQETDEATENAGVHTC